MVEVTSSGIAAEAQSQYLGKYRQVIVVITITVFIIIMIQRIVGGRTIRGVKKCSNILVEGSWGT